MREIERKTERETGGPRLTDSEWEGDRQAGRQAGRQRLERKKKGDGGCRDRGRERVTD